jgi:FkbM family methyltransferase
MHIMLKKKSNINFLTAPEGTLLRKKSLALQIATVGYKLLPRGKAAFARAVGKVFLGNRGFVQVPTLHDLSLVVPAEAFDMAAFLQAEKNWDDHVLEECVSRIETGGVFYDIGSNLGYIGLGVARSGLTNLSTFAFEPNLKLAQAIAMASEVNNLNVDVLSVALSDQNTEVDLFIPSHSIHASLIARKANAHRVRVQCFRLDDLVMTGKIPPPSVMKIDVEGAEYKVFNGAQKILRRHKPVLIYECDSNAHRFGHSREDVEAILTGFGYGTITRITNREGKLTNDYVALPTV